MITAKRPIQRIAAGPGKVTLKEMSKKIIYSEIGAVLDKLDKRTRS